MPEDIPPDSSRTEADPDNPGTLLTPPEGHPAPFQGDPRTIADTPPELRDPLVGRTFGQYEILAKLGRGGMANVYCARQVSIGREVAVKVLPSQFMQDQSFLTRFYTEVQVIAKLEHPRILPVHDFGEIDGMPYIVMRLMPGGSLSDLIYSSPAGIPLEQVSRLISQVAEGLDFAHQHNIIHRDFKPSNVLLDQAGNAYLADFGIAKVAEMSVQLTGSGAIGTPAYMAPELAEPDTLSPLVDVYALGVTLYEMVTGEQPFRAATPMGVLMAHISRPIPMISAVRPHVPAYVQEVVNRGMAKAPSERYQSALALADDLARRIAGRSGLSEPVPRTLAEPTPRPVVSPMQQPLPAPGATAQARPRRSVSPLMVGGGVFAALVCIGIGVGAVALSGFLGADGSGSASGAPLSVLADVGAVKDDEAPPTDTPTSKPPSAPLATNTPRPTATPDPIDDIHDAILEYDEEVRHLLETGDTSRIAQVASGQALSDRLEAADILRRAGNCVWDYNHKGITFLEVDYMGNAKAEVLALINRDGTVFCGPVERSEFAFRGPFEALFTVEYLNGRWIVTDYNPDPHT